MQLHTLQPKTKKQGKKTIGRGGARGKTSGRGHKGQKARAGHKIRPEIRDVIKRIPKLRGYRFNSRMSKPAVVNLSDIEATFDAQATVSPQTLLDAKVIRRSKGRIPAVKILGNGDLSKAVTVTKCSTSKVAAEKIIKAGGSIAS